MRYFIFTLLAGILFTSSIFGQAEKFVENPETFVEQLNERFKNTSDKKAAKEFIEEFALFWSDTTMLSPEEQMTILKTCNIQAVKRARPYPDYHTYLSTIMIFKKNGHDQQSYTNWHLAVNDLFKDRKFQLRHFNNLLRLSQEFVLNNTVFETPSVKWKSNNKTLRYTYENEKLSIKISESDLICLAKADSIIIHNTSGVVYPLEEIWYGEKGNINWERAGFHRDSVYANFGNYKIQMDQSDFQVDSVEFYNKHYFDYPLDGSIHHKVLKIDSPQSARYPKFTSTGKRFTIENIHPNINYEGGFSQNGAKFLGSSVDDEPAIITVLKNDTVFITAKAENFALRKNTILSNLAEIKVKLDTAYIYHPGLVFKYMADTKEIHLIRQGDGLAMSPYFDTFHNVSMDVELIKWKVGDQFMELKMISGAAENKSNFESLSFYREGFYNQLQGMDAIHPLQGLKTCSDYFHGYAFTVQDYARYMGLPENQLRQQVMGLSLYGFVEYNVNTDLIQIRQRLKDYLLFRLGKKDYDVITFNSQTPGITSNGLLDLKNYDLNLNGVTSVAICDHQNVIFFPRKEKLILKANRNFIFDGVISAGMLNLFGNGFKFSYENFQIDMSNIDSLKMKVQSGETDYFGQPILKDVKNTIAGLSGSLKIDAPDNKSGNANNPQYPILKSDIDSHVYYDSKATQGGAYSRKDFYFVLDPFEMDSLNTLTPENFNFSGKFHSNIFPDFGENLTIREDYSLGFKRATPPEGYPIYDGKARFTKDIDLSFAGLKGNGNLEYLTSTSKSESFTFLPDRTKGNTQEFSVKYQTEGVEYPDVNATFTFIEFVPEEDYLTSTSLDENFVMYREEAELSGEVTVAPGGLTGSGKLNMLRATLNSPKYNFYSRTLDADLSDFSLVAGEVEGVSFSTDNLVSHLDFDQRQGTFKSISGGSKVEFTDNRYISYMSNFSWHMDKNDIYLGARGTEGNKFISVHRKQDSLSFLVPMARYDVENKTIYAEEVKKIDVGDANLMLNNGFVTIHENAVIDPLDSVVILVNDTAHTHKLYDARVTVQGKYAYTGYGKYDFTNGADKTYTLNMHKIEMNNDEKRTQAFGTISEKDFVNLDSHFAYKGKVNLKAENKHLSFDGGVQMLHPCRNGVQTYIRFEDIIDPKNIKIPVGEQIQNFEYENIYKDFFITKDSTHIYSSFLENRKDYSDVSMITSQGYLIYNEKVKSFDIASEIKHENPDTTGSLIRYNEFDCNVMASGKFDVGIDMDQIKLNNSGTIIHKREDNEFIFSSMMSINFFFDQTSIDILYSAILNSEAKISNLSSDTFISRMAEWIGRAEATKYDKARSTVGVIPEMNPAINKTFLFSNIDMKWKTSNNSYIADGNADLAFIKDYSINKTVDLKLKITRKRSGNSLDFYLQFDSKNWVYYSYKNGMMQTLSSDQAYNDFIQGLKSEERKQKVGLGEKSYSFILAPDSKKKRFLSTFNKDDSEEISDEEVEETTEETKVIEEETKNVEEEELQSEEELKKRIKGK